MLRSSRLALIILILFTGTTCAQQRVDSFDVHVLRSIALTRTPQQTKAQRILSDANNYVNIAVPAGLLAGGIIDRNKDMRQNALYVASSTATTALLNWGLKMLVKRPRPFRAFAGFEAVYPARGHSFPSGHTSASFSTALALSRAYPKWYVIGPSMLWAGAVGYSRMYLGVHNPSDVAAGALLGAGTAWGFGFIRP